MKLLEERIRKDGRILPGDVLKVDSFLNHQIDVALISECGAEWKRLFENEGVTRILTIEASGIGIACVTALHFGVPVVFAKKTRSLNLSGDCYTTKVHSYTKGLTYDVMVSKKYIEPGDKVLIIDDFLAKGSALNGLIELVEAAGATVVGCGIAVEKAYQGGGNELRAKGYRIESLAKIESMTPGEGIRFS